jgi:hypothetical protein
MTPRSQPRSRLKQSQHPHLSSCLQKQCQLANSSRLSELLTWTRRLPEQRTLYRSTGVSENEVFREVKKHKNHNSNDTSQSAKKSAKAVPTSASVKLPPKAVSTNKFFAPLRTTDTDKETAGAENTLPEHGGFRK